MNRAVLLWERASRCFALFAALASLSSLLAFAGDSLLLTGGGVGNLRHSPRQGYASLEFTHTFGDSSWGLWTTADMSSDEAYVGGGLYLQWKFAGRWLVGIGSGPGWFSETGSLDLGSRLEFRSSGYIYYAVRDRFLVGLSVSHYSNGGAAPHNPGAESVRLFIAFSPGVRSGR